MINPIDLGSEINTDKLEASIDAAIREQFAKCPNDEYLVYVETLEGWSDCGWYALRRKYDKYWTLSEKKVMQPLPYIHAILFVPKLVVHHE